MIQSHLLQLVCLLAMEAQLTLRERDLRDRKLEVLRATRRARYTAGRTGDQNVPSYVDEPSVDPIRATETVAEVVLHVANWRWAGVPFILRSGKALARDRRTIAVHFRRVPHVAFERSEPCGNVLRLDLDPDRMALAINVNAEGDPFRLACIELDAELPVQRLPAYSRLLVHALEGDVTLSIRGGRSRGGLTHRHAHPGGLGIRPRTAARVCCRIGRATAPCPRCAALRTEPRRGCENLPPQRAGQVARRV